MFTTQQTLLAGGVLAWAWAVIYGLMCRGGHRKQLYARKHTKG